MGAHTTTTKCALIVQRSALDAQGLIYWIVTSDRPGDWDEASRVGGIRLRVATVDVEREPVQLLSQIHDLAAAIAHADT